MNKIKIEGVPATMLQTVYARARESQKSKPKFKDKKAEEIVEQLDYNFSAARRDWIMRTGVVARTILFDRLIKAFLVCHPHTTVINIGCGLDTRCVRYQNLYDHWYNLDLKETMDIRHQFLSDNKKMHSIVMSCLDEEWVKQVEPNELYVIVIEGLLMYFNEEEVHTLFRILDQHFPKMIIVAEVMSPLMVAHVKEKSIQQSNAKFKWGMTHGEELSNVFPNLEHLKDVSLVEGMKEVSPIYKLLAKSKRIYDISNKICVYEKE